VAKDSSRITDGELQRLVESWESESLLKKIKHPHMLFGSFLFFKNAPHQNPKQTPAYSVVRHDLIFKRHRVLWSDETKKRAFWL